MSASRRGVVVLGALALVLWSAPARAEGGDVRFAAVNTVGVLSIENGELTPNVVTDAPPSADLQRLTIERATNGYVATLTFAGPYQIFSPDQIVFVSIQSPDGTRQRISLDGKGVAQVSVAEDGQFAPKANLTPSVQVAGNTVVFELGDLINFDGPDAATFEIQGHALFLPTWHSHTNQVTVGGLLGLAAPRSPSVSEESSTSLPLPLPDPLPLSKFANVLVSGSPIFFKPPVELPAEAQLVAISAGGPGEVLLQLGGTPSLVGTQVGDPSFTVAKQVFGIEVAQTIDEAALQLYQWATNAASEGVVKEGDTIRIKLPSGATPFVDSGPFDVTASAKPVSCGGSTVTFPVTVEVKDGLLSITHADGDIASGRFDPLTYTATLTSPMGRVYVLHFGDGQLTGTHTYQACDYDLTTTGPLDIAGGGPALTDPYIRPFSYVLDADGNGLVMFGPRMLFSALNDLVVPQQPQEVSETTTSVVGSGVGVVDSPSSDDVTSTVGKTTDSKPADAGTGAVVDGSTETDVEKVQAPVLGNQETFKKDDGGGNGLGIGLGIGGGILALGGAAALIKKLKFSAPQVQTRQDPATGMLWVVDDHGRPLRPAFWVLGSDGKWGPPAGQDHAMQARFEYIQSANALLNSPTTVAGRVDNIADPVDWFICKTYIEMIDAFSGGTLTEVDHLDGLGTASGIGKGVVVGTKNAINIVTLGFSEQIRLNIAAQFNEISKAVDLINDPNASWIDKAIAMEHIVELVLKGAGEGVKHAIIDLLPYDEINTLRSGTATTEEKTKAALNAVAKIAGLFALALGGKAALAKWKTGKATKAPKNPVLNQGGIYEALEPRNPELSKGGVHNALPGDNVELNQGGVHEAITPSETPEKGSTGAYGPADEKLAQLEKPSEALGEMPAEEYDPFDQPPDESAPAADDYDPFDRPNEPTPGPANVDDGYIDLDELFKKAALEEAVRDGDSIFEQQPGESVDAAVDRHYENQQVQEGPYGPVDAQTNMMTNLRQLQEVVSGHADGVPATPETVRYLFEQYQRAVDAVKGGYANIANYEDYFLPGQREFFQNAINDLQTHDLNYWLDRLNQLKK